MGKNRTDLNKAFFSHEGRRWIVFFLGLFGVAMGYVFAPVLSKWMAITSPDSWPFYREGHVSYELEYLLAGTFVWTPHKLALLVDPLFFHDYAYMICQLSLGLAGVYYLKTQRLSWIPAVGGGLFLSFSGYLFTLFSAGHLGFFHLFSCVFWGLGLLNRCFETRRPVYYALLGCVIMWGQPNQPDVWILTMALLGGYAIWKTILECRAGGSVKPVLLGVYPRFLLTLVIAGLVGVTGVRLIFTQHLAGRDKQIESVSGGPATGNEPGDVAKKKFERWIFATNWSLPPEDLAEMVVPGIYGNDSFSPPFPYWGRLGRANEFQPGRMMPNYRQHTVYMGLVSLIFAFFGFSAWIVARLSKKSKPIARSKDLTVIPPVFEDVPFWTCVWVVTLILAMGRYTPLYKVFYSIPYMDYLRAPVKFLHLTEVATAFLAAFGLEAFVQWSGMDRFRRGWIIAMAGLIALFVFSAWMVGNQSAAIEGYIASIGLAPFASALRHYMADNLLRAAGLGVLLTLIFALGLKRGSGRKVAFAALAAVVIGVADLSEVARRHVIPINVAPFHQPSLVVQEMKALTKGAPANVANYVTRNEYGRDWFSTALVVNGFANQIPSAAQYGSANAKLMMALKDDPIMFWRLTGVRFVLSPSKQMEGFCRKGILRKVVEFQLDGGAVRRSEAGPNGMMVGEFGGVGLPAVHFNWQGDVAAELQISKAVENDDGVPVTDAPETVSRSEHSPQAVVFSRYRGQKNVLATEGIISLPMEGLLIFNDPFLPDLEVLVDGKRVSTHQANGLWLAAIVPAGNHHVICRMKRNGLWNFVALGTSLIVCIWGLASLMTQRAHLNGSPDERATAK